MEAIGVGVTLSVIGGALGLLIGELAFDTGRGVGLGIAVVGYLAALVGNRTAGGMGPSPGLRTPFARLSGKHIVFGGALAVAIGLAVLFLEYV